MSSTATIPLLTLIGQRITVLMGIPTLLFGIIGCMLNIMVFLSLKTFRESSCALFFIVSSIVNIGQLSTGLLTRIMISGFTIDWAENSVLFCKFRSFALQFFSLCSYTFMTLATIDQYMATAKQRHWQQFFSFTRAQRSCFVFIIIWFLHGIPALVWYDLGISSRTGKVSCVGTNSNYQNYVNYVYLLILSNILPFALNITFGSLAYRNVRQIPYRTVPLVRRELDKQLTVMCLVQVVTSSIFLFPYMFVFVMSTVISLSKITFNSTLLGFLNLVAGLIYYLHFAVCQGKIYHKYDF